MAKKCPRCKSRVGELASSCWKCKAPLRESESESKLPYYERDWGTEEIRPEKLYKKPKMGTGKKIVIIVIVLFLIFLSWTSYVIYVEMSKEEDIRANIGEFGVDYWFEETEDGREVLKTEDGWTFEMNVRQEYTLEGIILSSRYYYKDSVPDSPCNTFSPVDIWVGVGDVCENVNRYDYEITYFRAREIRWTVYNDYDYFRTHTGLNHLIPHNAEAYSEMLDLKEKDKFSLSGYIVEPYGTKGDEWISWPSDNQIGNYECEVILVDVINVQ